jgi:HEAT repeat protein
LICVCVLFSFCLFAFSSVGGIAWVYERYRGSGVKGDLARAMNENPPDVSYMLGVLRSPSWAVAMRAMSSLSTLISHDVISTEEEQLIAESLLHILAKKGHWWRFGWDLDEPEYHGFRETAVSTLSALGEVATEPLAEALDSRQKGKQEAACWVLANMVRTGRIDMDHAKATELLGRASQLTQSSPHENVRSSCSRVLELIGKADP